LASFALASLALASLVFCACSATVGTVLVWALVLLTLTRLTLIRRGLARQILDAVDAAVDRMAELMQQYAKEYQKEKDDDFQRPGYPALRAIKGSEKREQQKKGGMYSAAAGLCRAGGSCSIQDNMSSSPTRVALKRGISDHPAPGKLHASPTPYLGGVAVFVAIGVVAASNLVSRNEARIIEFISPTGRYERGPPGATSIFG
jgi:hypothetical protein